MSRHVIYLTGSRADFGLMRSTLELLNKDFRLHLGVIVTGQHMLYDCGMTVDEVDASGLPVVARIKATPDGGDGGAMSRAIAATLVGVTQVLEHHKPDVLLLLGDRGEMLAGALAALHLNTPIAHIHGGERSGTVDEPIRHAISKLAHYHMTSTEDAKRRLVRMGELESSIFVTGAPGLDGLVIDGSISRAEMFASKGLDPYKELALVVFHPVVQSANLAGDEIKSLLDAVSRQGLQALCLMPNSDAGNHSIRMVYEEYATAGLIRIANHLPRADFLRWMQVADVMAGNSSSGIIEATTFRLPVVNVGARQHAREHAGNVIDCDAITVEIEQALCRALALRGSKFVNPYGNGDAGRKIVDLLATLPLPASLLSKLNTY
jgi:GDP/UDP-N,N'-diacetylbacillosamine 2-epimerase (hydrolysing)